MRYTDFKVTAEILSFIGLTAFLFGLGAFEGLRIVTLELTFAFISLHVAFLQAFATHFIISATFLFFGSYRLLQNARPDNLERKITGEKMTAIVPVYKDSGVLHRSVESLKRSNYDDLEIKIVCEEGDEESIEAAKKLSDTPGVDFLLSSHGSKAEAINLAADRTDSKYLSFFDADEVIDPDFIPSAVKKLEDCGAVKGRRIYEPEGFSETLAYGTEIIFQVVDIFGKLLGFKFAGSSSTAVHRDLFKELDGFDDLAAEDWDFSHKCYIKGVKVEVCFENPSIMKAPHSLRDYWDQRKRWILGQIQVLRKNAFKALEERKPRIFASVLVSSLTVLGSIMILTTVSKFILPFFFGISWLNFLPLIAMSFVTLGMLSIDSYHGYVNQIGLSWVFIPLAYTLFGLLALKAALEYLFTWNGRWYHVSK